MGRRESNPQESNASALENKASYAPQNGPAADWQRMNCHFGDVLDCDLEVIRELLVLHSLWPQLPAETRAQILNYIGGFAEPTDL